MRSAAKLNCHLMLPVSVGACWGPDRSCHPRRAVLPSSAAEIREFLVFVHSGVGCTLVPGTEFFSILECNTSAVEFKSFQFVTAFPLCFEECVPVERRRPGGPEWRAAGREGGRALERCTRFCGHEASARCGGP